MNLLHAQSEGLQCNCATAKDGAALAAAASRYAWDGFKNLAAGTPHLTSEVHNLPVHVPTVLIRSQQRQGTAASASAFAASAYAWLAVSWLLACRQAFSATKKKWPVVLVMTFA